MVGNNKDKKTTRETFGSIDPATGAGRISIVFIILGGIIGIVILYSIYFFSRMHNLRTQTLFSNKN